ncbi:AI-2E family transporter [Photobacterium lipolyticum]|uniref:AI-2E family transporter n=1 Tax=Photobacterium lipolyticum TaxID=266810 RepID=A0A2T3N360_9GAMM|nr:AI-2E family transporter [Photobacterium lipolyticum]PSW06715.1 AI-2E family transporter [Photobacterium lipolyticum]
MEQHQFDYKKQSQFFVNNIVESAIRVGLLFILIVWSFGIVKPFLIPVLWGAIIAVALMPLTLKLEALFKGRRGLAATMIALIGITLFVVPFVLFTISLIEAIEGISTTISSGTFKIPGPTEKVAEVPIIGQQLFDIWQLFSTNLEKAFTRFLPQLTSGITALASLVGSSIVSVLMFVISLFISAAFMAHASSISQSINALSIRIAGNSGAEWTSLCTATIRSVLLGVVGVACIQALLVGIGVFAIGLPAAGLVTVLVLLLAIAQLPALLVVAPVIAYVYSIHDTTTATIFTVWSLLAGLSDNFLKPLLMGRGLDIPMPVILIGAIGGMIVSGLLGLFIGPVVLAIWYQLFITWMHESESATESKEQANATDQPPLSEGASLPPKL